MLVGAKLGDIEAGRMRHVDHVSVRQDHKLVLLQTDEDRRSFQCGQLRITFLLLLPYYNTATSDIISSADTVVLCNNNNDIFKYY